MVVIKKVGSLLLADIKKILEATIENERIIVKKAEMSLEKQTILVILKSSTLKGRLRTLKTIEEGKYGICVDCGGEISEGRLKAKLTALRCISCQKEHEAEYGRV